MDAKGSRLQDGWDARGGLPLDRLVRERLGLSWKDAKRLVTTGKVHVNGCLCTTPQVVPDQGAEITVNTDRRRPSRRPSLSEGSLLFLDEHLLVVDKPPGLVSVPPTPTGEPTVLDHLVRLTDARVLAVHRLDHGTSGLMLFARNHAAAAALDTMFRRHEVRRTYLAICHGHPDAPARWTEPLTLRKPGKPRLEVSAITNLLSAEPAGPAALLHLALETGRWHQVRLHAALHGHPLLRDQDHGDPILDKPLRPGRVALHSHTLRLTHPMTGTELHFELPLPPDLADLLSAFC